MQMICACGAERLIRKNGGRDRAYCVECERRRISAYSGNAKHQADKRAWNHRNREKRRAHKAVELALLAGRMTAQPCEVCGALRAHAHHDDYSKPLDVKWLCAVHHGARHRQMRCEAA